MARRLSWANFVTSLQQLPHKIEVNAHNFEVNLARKSEEYFKESFERKGFDGKPWVRSNIPRKLTNGMKLVNGTLVETGVLKNSITSRDIASTTWFSTKIYTDTKGFNTPGHRHQGFCYAGVHNDLNRISDKPLRGPKYERKFMGNSSVLRKYAWSIIGSVLHLGTPFRYMGANDN